MKRVPSTATLTVRRSATRRVGGGIGDVKHRHVDALCDGVEEFCGWCCRPSDNAVRAGACDEAAEQHRRSSERRRPSLPACSSAANSAKSRLSITRRCTVQSAQALRDPAVDMFVVKRGRRSSPCLR